MSPEARRTLQSIIDLLLTMPGVGQPEVQAVTHFLGVIVDEHEAAET